MCFLKMFGKILYQLRNVLNVRLSCILNLRDSFGMNYKQLEDTEVLGESLFHYHSVYRESHLARPEIESRLPC
jgi:hypothetical protein